MSNEARILTKNPPRRHRGHRDHLQIEQISQKCHCEEHSNAAILICVDRKNLRIRSSWLARLSLRALRVSVGKIRAKQSQFQKEFQVSSLKCQGGKPATQTSHIPHHSSIPIFHHSTIPATRRTCRTPGPIVRNKPNFDGPPAGSQGPAVRNKANWHPTKRQLSAVWNMGYGRIERMMRVRNKAIWRPGPCRPDLRGLSRQTKPIDTGVSSRKWQVSREQSAPAASGSVSA